MLIIPAKGCVFYLDRQNLSKHETKETHPNQGPLSLWIMKKYAMDKHSSIHFVFNCKILNNDTLSDYTMHYNYETEASETSKTPEFMQSD